MVASQTVVDVRAAPRTSAQSGIHDPQQETQLLFAEHVKVKRRQDGWALIEAIEQPEYTHANRWRGYPGWVPETALEPANRHTDEPTIVVTAKWAQVWADPFQMQHDDLRIPLGTQLWGRNTGQRIWRVELPDGSSGWLDHDDAVELRMVRRLSAQQKRQHIIAAAEQFLGDPYFWGGRSPFWGHTASAAQPTTGVDCSGLVNLAHRAAGIEIPRDAHEQFLRARSVASLRPGDVIFLSERGDPNRIVHVMLYAGAGEVIEGPGTGKPVRRIALADRFGRAPAQLVSGADIDEQRMYFGTYLP